jgi:hypothetical protein
LPANPLVNALWLSPLARADQPQEAMSLADPLARALALRSVERGRAAAESVDSRRVVDPRPGWRVWIWTLAVGLAVASVLATYPRLVGGGLVRLVDPWGDHPPFSLTRFEVRVTPDAIEPGGDAKVELATRGKRPSRAELVQVDAGGQEVQRWPLRGVQPGRWERNLSNLRQSMTFYVAAETGRSRRVQVAVQPPRPPVSATDEAHDDPATARDAVQPDKLPSDLAAAARGVWSRTPAP